VRVQCQRMHVQSRRLLPFHGLATLRSDALAPKNVRETHVLRSIALFVFLLLSAGPIQAAPFMQILKEARDARAAAVAAAPEGKIMSIEGQEDAKLQPVVDATVTDFVSNAMELMQGAPAQISRCDISSPPADPEFLCWLDAGSNDLRAPQAQIHLVPDKNKASMICAVYFSGNLSPHDKICLSWVMSLVSWLIMEETIEMMALRSDLDGDAQYQIVVDMEREIQTRFIDAVNKSWNDRKEARVQIGVWSGRAVTLWTIPKLTTFTVNARVTLE